MKSSSKFFNDSKMLPVDKFFNNVLYDKKNGYYNTSQPLGERGDYITSPIISNLFSEMIAIWIISVWENLGKPKIFNIVELGPGDGSLTKTLLDVLKRFPQINAAKNIYLFEISKKLKKIQKKKINNNEIRWIKNFSQIKRGPVIFFGNEFFDAIPIKQFKRRDKILLEKHYTIKNNSIIRETFKKAKKQDEKNKFFQTLKIRNLLSIQNMA